MSAIYRRLIHRTEPNRPHISSDISNFKERRDKSDWMRPNFLARPACIISVFSLASRCRVARLAPRQSVSARPVRGVLRLWTGTRKCFFREKCIFCSLTFFAHVYRGLELFLFANLGSIRNIVSARPATQSQIWGYSPVYTQLPFRISGESRLNRCDSPRDSPNQPKMNRCESENR